MNVLVRASCYFVGMRSWWRLLLLLVVALVLVPTRRADASIEIIVAFDDLVRDSTSVGIMTPVEQKAIWEDGRIVTYTRVHVDETVAGDLAAGDEAWVASLGGIVGDVGQTVNGEPQLRVGVPALLFLRPDRAPGLRVVTARAQGYFGVRWDAAAKVRRFRASNAVGLLLPPQRGLAATKRTAAEAIADRPGDQVLRDIADAWRRLHAK